jgi:hypothetical protein
MVKFSAVLAVPLLLFLATASSAKVTVDVQKSTDLEVVESVALLPASCPAHIDCIWMDDRLAEEFAKHAPFRVISARRVKQALFDLGIAALDESTRAAVLEKLDADALVVPVVIHSGKESEGAVGVVSGPTVVVVPDEKKSGRVSLTILAPDGHQLLRGEGHVRSGNDLKGERGVILMTFRKLLEEAFAK